MATQTLATLVTAVRAEAGHALALSQGINSVDTIKHMIRRTEYELWTAFLWPKLKIRTQVDTVAGQYLYEYPPEMEFDQIRQVWYADSNSSIMNRLEYEIPESCINPNGTNSTSGSPVKWEDGQDDSKFRVWPTPNRTGFIRLVGQRQLNDMVDDADYCTLDATLISLFVAAELLGRAKAEDAAGKVEKAKRHLQKLLGQGNKDKVSTFGSSRGGSFNGGLRPFLDFIP